MSIRVLIADDHPLYRQGLCTALSRGGCEVIADVASGEDAIAAYRRHCADVVVMDVNMPGAGGIEATRELCALDPAAKVLVLTMVEEEDTLLAAIDAGARGYVMKGAGRDEILRAVTAVHDGQVVFGQEMAALVLDRLRNRAPAPPPFPQLTDSERAVLDLLAAGRRNQEIATALHLGYKTVRNYVSSIFDKLGVDDREAAAAAARQAGLGRARK